MYPPAMDLTSPHVQHKNIMFWIIQNGVRLTGMPSWRSSISEDDTWKLARFIHNIARLDAAATSAGAFSATNRRFLQDKYSLKVPNGLAVL